MTKAFPGFFAFLWLISATMTNAHALPKYCVGSFENVIDQATPGRLVYSLHCDDGQNPVYTSADHARETTKEGFRKGLENTLIKKLGVKLVTKSGPVISGMMIYARNDIAANVPGDDYGFIFRDVSEHRRKNAESLYFESLYTHLNGDIAQYGDKEVQRVEDYQRVNALLQKSGYKAIGVVKVKGSFYKSSAAEVLILQKT